MLNNIICLILVFILILLSIFVLYKTKILTKEFRNEIKYREIVENNLNNIKLKEMDYDIDAAINLLIKKNIKSNFSLKNNEKGVFLNGKKKSSR